MKVDRIFKNTKIFTSNLDNPRATALVVKESKFVYVGDETGLSDYEGETTDLCGKFIMPGIIDSHVHITTGVGFEYTDLGVYITCADKKGALDFMTEYIGKNPGLPRYRFMLERAVLNGEEITKEDLDYICPNSELVILEGECHSVWVNSKILDKHRITDDTLDPVPELSYYVRKEGHVTGNAYESAGWPFLFDHLKNITDEQIGAAVERWIEFSVKTGVTSVFDAGFPEHEALHERVYSYLRELDRQGRLPVYVDGCYILTNPRKMKNAVEETKRFKREFDTEHLKVHTLKILMDGTLKIETAALITPYEDTGVTGATTFNADEIAEILRLLNEAGLDLHVHTVGERASRIVLDGVEQARKELGDSFRVKVTCAHLEIQDDDDLERFAKLGVIANYTPAWHNGNMGGSPSEFWPALLGENRTVKMYRCKTLWDTGALVTWSSDDVAYEDFTTWNPYYHMEVGMTRWITEKTNGPEHLRNNEAFAPLSERMGIEEMILGYTINGAKQLGIEVSKGSIEAGKDADFLVFDNDLLTAEHEGFSYNKPRDVYFCGKKVN